MVAGDDGAVGGGRRSGPLEHGQPVRAVLHDEGGRLRHGPRRVAANRRSPWWKPDARESRRPLRMPRESAPPAAGRDAGAAGGDLLNHMTDDRTKPVLPGTAATDYERYLRTDELLSLQKTPNDVAHHDEHLFQTVHQSSELWLKLACIEIETATALIENLRVAPAVRLLRRANDCMQLVTGQLCLLEHMNPVDYAVVRTALGHGAGFDSPGFRRVHQVSPALGQAFDA